MTAAFITQPTVCGGYLHTLDDGVKKILITDEAVRADFMFNEDRELTSFTIPVEFENYSRKDRSVITFMLCDEAGNEIWQQSIAITEINSLKLTLKIDNIRVYEGKQYTLSVYREILDNYQHSYAQIFDWDNSVLFWLR